MNEMKENKKIRVEGSRVKKSLFCLQTTCMSFCLHLMSVC